jgi:hypothetical protein
MILVSPFTGKLIDASDEFVGQLLGAGFKEQEPEAVEAEEVSAPRARRARKTTK